MKQDSTFKIIPYPYFVLLILSLVNLLNYVDRFIFAALIPYIKIDTAYTDEQIGWIGSAFTWVYTLFAPMFGLLGDKFHRGKLISLGVTIWSLATAAAGLSKNFIQLLFTRSAVGIGEANYATIAPSLLSDFFSKARRGLAMSIFFAAIPLGTAIGYVIGGHFGHPTSLGWRHTLYLVGLPGLLVAFILYILREPQRGATEEFINSNENISLNWKEKYLMLIKNRAYLFACFGYAAVTFALGALVFWAPEWLRADKGMQVEGANNILGVCAIIGGSIGTLGGGILSDWLNARIQNAYSWVCSVSALLAAIPTVVAILSSNQVVYTTSIFLAITLVFLGNGPVNTLIINVVPVSIRTTALGLVVVIIHCLGDGISLSFVGTLSTWINKTLQAGIELPYWMTLIGKTLHLEVRTHSLSFALLITPVAMIVGGIFYYLGVKSSSKVDN